MIEIIIDQINMALQGGNINLNTQIPLSFF